MRRRYRIKVVAAEFQGSFHRANDIVCQDVGKAHRFRGSPAACVALADGAGSASHSRIGAEYVVSKIPGLVHSHFERFYENKKKAIEEIVSNLQQGLNRVAKRRQWSVNSLDSTLLFVYVRKTGAGARYLAGHIGDGMIAYTRSDNAQILSFPYTGEFLNTTAFVTSGDAYERFRIYNGEIPGDSSFILMTDGSCECLYHRTNKMLAPACLRMVRWLRENTQQEVERALRENLEYVISRKTTDDCSIALLSTVGID